MSGGWTGLKRSVLLARATEWWISEYVCLMRCYHNKCLWLTAILIVILRNHQNVLSAWIKPIFVHNTRNDKWSIGLVITKYYESAHYCARTTFGLTFVSCTWKYARALTHRLYIEIHYITEATYYCENLVEININAHLITRCRSRLKWCELANNTQSVNRH